MQRLEEISDEIHHKRNSIDDRRGVGVGAESPVHSSPMFAKALRKLSLESSQTLSQMIPTINWYSRSDSRSETNSERDDCESVADSVATNDTLDDTVIENLSKNFNYDSDFDTEPQKTTIL